MGFVRRVDFALFDVRVDIGWETGMHRVGESAAARRGREGGIRSFFTCIFAINFFTPLKLSDLASNRIPDDYDMGNQAR